ncbi:low-affinity phosphate transporter [Puccinia graminis f. sp. tritici]|uniref:Low-affinity phosphate transporter n=1 Tax=Puccinia graminis f. sp. tritici TaxID=56615 RepID=A0A5B0MD62_PUCGR|nr:low-affinity phosphate transporter [Puccinia graminis f. sp. tritici]
MKFSHSLLFSTVPEWQSYYVSYDSLKATIYKIEKDQASSHQSSLRLSSQPSSHPSRREPAQSDSSNNELQDHENNESTGLLQNHDGSPEQATSIIELQPNPLNLTPSDRIFLELLSQELAKVEEFYQSKQQELFDELNGLINEIETIEKQGMQLIQDSFNQSARSTDEAIDDEDDDEDDEEEEDNGRGEEGTSNQPRRVSPSTKRQQLLKSASIFGILPILGFSSKASRPTRSTSLSRSRGSSKNPTPHRVTKNQNAHLIDVNPSTSVTVTKPTSPTSPLAPQFAPRASLSLDVSTRAIQADTSQHRSAISKWLPHSPKTSRSLSLGSQTAHRRPSQNVPAPNLSEFWMSNVEFIHDSRVFFKRRITQLFVNLNSLKTYIDLNFTAFRKILKKYDKVFGSSLSSHFLEECLLHQSKAFNPTTISQLQAHLDSLFPIYARLITQGDEEMARKQLNAHLREQVVWERNTIWRDMIGMERKGWANSSRTVIDKPFARTNTGSLDPTQALTAIPPKPMGFQEAFKNLFKLEFWTKILFNPSVFWCLVATCGFILSMKYSNFKSEPERNCLAMLVFVVVLWTSEALPLFVTGMFVPLLVIVLRVIRDKTRDNERMDSSHAAVFVIGQMFNPTIVLLLGAFTLAAVLSKHNIDKVMAAKLLSLAGTKPRAVLFAYMAVTCFASMWISNVAAPVLSYSLAQPILRTIPTRSPYTRSLILGIALAADIGGQASPIASPQNLIALSYMSPPPSWIVWFSIGIPISALTIITTWAILTWSYEREFSYSKGTFDLEEEDPELHLLAPRSKNNEPILYIKPIPNPKDSFSLSQWFILLVSFLTILLWCFENLFHGYFGDMGVIALLPMIIFFGSGLLRKSDFDNFPWSIVFLAMSGIALGKSVLSSGLLDDMDVLIERGLKGLSLWPITILFGFLVLIISTFISHTVASVLLIPIAFEIGNSMEVNHARLLIFLTTFICSTGMGLPVSSFPNQTAVNLEDEFGTRYLSSKDFLKFGLLSSFFGFLIILTIGFMILLVFGY